MMPVFLPMMRCGVLLAALVVLAAGCKPRGERREREFFPDMYRNPAVKAQEGYEFFRAGMGNVLPPEGTVPIGFVPYPYDVTEGLRAGEELRNPLPRTPEVLEVGRKYYNIHCMVCHGPVGAGDGLATMVHRPEGLPVPPELYSSAIRDEWKDGQIYHNITLGQGQMPGYAASIDPVHRWAIVHYVRALGAAAAPAEEWLEEAERRGWDAERIDSQDSPLRERTPDAMKKKQSIFRLVPEEAATR